MKRSKQDKNTKYEKKRHKFIYKIIFLAIMLVITGISIYKIDYEVDKMLGNEEKNIIETFVNIFN